MTYLLPLIVGQQQTRRMLLLGEDLDAEQAAVAGLVDEVVASDLFEARVEEFSQRLAAGSMTAMAETKALLHDSVALRRAVAAEIEATLRCQETEDHDHALSAFHERRPPEFRS